MANGLGHVTVMKETSRHTQDKYWSILDVAAWSRRQARESEKL